MRCVFIKRGSGCYLIRSHKGSMYLTITQIIFNIICCKSLVTLQAFFAYIESRVSQIIFAIKRTAIRVGSSLKQSPKVYMSKIIPKTFMFHPNTFPSPY